MLVVLARQEMWPELQRERAVTLGEGLGPKKQGGSGPTSGGRARAWRLMELVTWMKTLE